MCLMREAVSPAADSSRRRVGHTESENLSHVDLLLLLFAMTMLSPTVTF